MVKTNKDYGYTYLTFKDMSYFRLLSIILVVLMLLYYGMIVGHLFGFWKITHKEIVFTKACIPFYYWIVSQQK